jgi:hypothetical protein
VPEATPEPEAGDDGKGVIDRAQDAANTAVDTAQDVAAGAVKNAVADSDDDEKPTENQEKDSK